MQINRRRLLAGSFSAAATFVAPLGAYGIEATQFGVRPGAPDDQSRALQRAIEQAAQARAPLMLAPGTYRAGNLNLPAGTQLAGVRGATRIVLTRGPSLLSAENAENVSLTGLTLDGGSQPLPQGRGLVHLFAAKTIRVTDCTITGAGGNGIAIEQCDGAVTHSTIADAADNALFCNDNRGLMISGNSIARAGNGGIRIWQSEKRRDGSVIADNSIEDIRARDGGTGENGNAINIFRAGDVIVRGNHIRRTAFSAVRGNSASNIQIIGNNCAALDDVALYSEFEFEGCVIADNVIEDAGSGISVTNFVQGGRLATVRGNLMRNLGARQKGAPAEEFGMGIGIEAETTVSGNVVENAQTMGIRAGWGPYLRNVAITGNVLRDTGIGVGVTVVPGAGVAVISDNVIAGAKRGAIVGMEWRKTATGDLALAGAERYPHLRISGNQLS